MRLSGHPNQYVFPLSSIALIAATFNHKADFTGLTSLTPGNDQTLVPGTVKEGSHEAKV